MKLNIRTINAAALGVYTKLIKRIKKLDSKKILNPKRPLSINLNDSIITDLCVDEIRSQTYDASSRLALEASATGIWDWNIKNNVVFYSSEALKLIGLDSKDIFDNLEFWDRAVHPEDFHNYYSAINNHIDGITPYFENRHRVLTSTGRYKWILTRGKIVERDNNGKPIRLAGTHSDIFFQNERELSLIKNSKFFLFKKR